MSWTRKRLESIGSLAQRSCGIALTLCLVAPIVLQAQERGEIGMALGSSPEVVILEDLDGNPVDLSEFIGKTPVLFEFWASWCENCEALQPAMDAAFETYGDHVAFVAVAVAVNQTQRRVKRHFEDSHAVPYLVLWDTKGAGVRAFLAPATSYVVVLDRDGVVTYTGIGPDQDLDGAVRSAIQD
jgi:thiol-disulfide isomerase/thioredoxin